jgi:hypothetical protein
VLSLFCRPRHNRAILDPGPGAWRCLIPILGARCHLDPGLRACHRLVPDLILFLKSIIIDLAVVLFLKPIVIDPDHATTVLFLKPIIIDSEHATNVLFLKPIIVNLIVVLFLKPIVFDLTSLVCPLLDTAIGLWRR